MPCLTALKTDSWSLQISLNTQARFLSAKDKRQENAEHDTRRFSHKELSFLIVKGSDWSATVSVASFGKVI
jgi:hypothetical protein